MNNAPISRRARLRQATHEQHAELDALVSSLDLTKRSDYERYLFALAQGVIGFERALEAADVERHLPDWAQRRRRFALAMDLHALGLSACPAEIPGSLSPAAMFGVLYVLEGSRLGSQLLLSRVSGSKDEAVLGARHFLRMNDAKLWSSFLRTLEAYEPLGQDEMVLAARGAFEVFRHAFARLCCPSWPQDASRAGLAANVA